MRPFNAFTSLCIGIVSTALAAGCDSGSSGSKEGDDGSGGDGGSGPTKYTAFPVPKNEYSVGDPTANEQGLLELMQRVRANPPAEGPLLVDSTDSDVNNAIKQFGVDKQQVVSDFQTYKPVPPLVFNVDLEASSKLHSQQMFMTGVQAHNSPPCTVATMMCTGPSPFDRMTKAGYSYSFASENIFAFAQSLFEAHAGFLIDWGNKDLGHRHSYLDLDSPQRDVGIAVLEMNGPDNVGPLIITEDFGMPQDASQRFLLGVVYEDKNGNAFYDPGEGVAGYKIVPNSGDTYAVSSTSGGYAIPFAKNAGPVEVQAQGPDGVAIQQKSATFAGDNVKVDFVLTM